MKLIRNGIVVLRVKDDYIIIMQKVDPSGFDPTSTYWGLAQGFKVVTDLSTQTFVLVPIGQPTKVRVEDFRPGDLDDPTQS